jgi:hypothetical protein
MKHYPYISFANGEEITYSSEESGKTIVYIEAPAKDDFVSLSILLPDGIVTENNNFPEELTKRRLKQIILLKSSIMELAAQKKRKELTRDA